MRVPPKSFILVGFSIINHPAIGVPPFQEDPIYYIYILVGGLEHFFSHSFGFHNPN